MAAFANYTVDEKGNSTTLYDAAEFGVGYCPDYFDHALQRHTPYINHFHQLVATAPDSIALFRAIQADTADQRHKQALHVFRRFVCPIAAHGITVATMKMLNDRCTEEWILSR